MMSKPKNGTRLFGLCNAPIVEGAVMARAPAPAHLRTAVSGCSDIGIALSGRPLVRRRMRLAHAMGKNRNLFADKVARLHLRR
jgi:hypothetical protein